MDEIDADMRRVLRRGRANAAHVAGFAFGVVLAGFTGYTGWPLLWLATGVAFGISGVAGLMGEGFFLAETRSRFLRYGSCIPIAGWGIGGLFVGVGKLAGWLP